MVSLTDSERALLEAATALYSRATHAEAFEATVLAVELILIHRLERTLP